MKAPLPIRPNHAPGAGAEFRLEAEKREKARRTLRRAILLGGFGIIAVFAALEATRPSPSADDATKVALAKERQANFEKQADGVPPPTEVAPPAQPEKATPAGVTPAPIVKVEPSAETETSEDPPQPTEAELLAKEPELVLVGIEAGRQIHMDRHEDILKRTMGGKAWDVYRALLEKSIKAGLAEKAPGEGLTRFDSVWKEPALYQAILRWKVLGCFTSSDISARIADYYGGAMLTWLFHNNEAMEELLLTIHPSDDSAKVFGFLMDAWSSNQENFGKYFALAVACAVVFDRPMSIPSPIGNKKYGEDAETMVDPLKRYLWYVTKNEKGKLAVRINHLSARDLVWVVSAPVSTSELEWSLDKMHLRRKNWGSTYTQVEYVMERAVEGVSPYKEYSFAEILKEGGICSDQSYFCVNTARAQGIPAMILVGETDAGAHAWAGIKIDDDEWTTGVGRIGGVARGETSNPQTGSGTTEQEIQLWNDRYHSSPAITLKTMRHLWLADYLAAIENESDEEEAVRIANKIGHSFTETWRALYSLLERQTKLAGDPPAPENLEEWKTFAADMRREYKKNPRMALLAADAEVKFIFPYGKEGDANRALLRERRRIERDSGEQKDLIAMSLKRQAELIKQRGGPEVERDISRLYDRALRDYGSSITGFKMMAGDYFGYMNQNQELARKAARDIELAFKRVVETKTTNWFRATTESEIYKMICSYYRTAGDPDRADFLEKRYKTLLRRAKRAAL